jgi:hypothetical protein
MNYKVELRNGMKFICNHITDCGNNYAITIGDNVSFISISSVRWIDPTFESTQIRIHRNQADRNAEVIFVSEKHLLVRYQMPNGKVFHNFLLPNGSYKSVKLSF